MSLLFLADDFNRQRSRGKESLTTSDPKVLSLPSSDSDPGNRAFRQMLLSIPPLSTNTEITDLPTKLVRVSFK